MIKERLEEGRKRGGREGKRKTVIRCVPVLTSRTVDPH